MSKTKKIFTLHRRTALAEMRPFEIGENLIDVSISTEDVKAGSPKEGDWIARNPKNNADQWLVSKDYYAENLVLFEKHGVVNEEDPFNFDTPEVMNIEVTLGRETIADKSLRKGLDLHLQVLRTCPSSRERSLSITKLQESIMWLGMDLKRINDTAKENGFKISENPYPNSYDPSNTVIEPTADGLKL